MPGAFPPDYLQKYPNLSRVRLSAVKQGIYNPRLPTFRRMDMDTATHKLPDEHSRSSTTLGPEDFYAARSSNLQHPKNRLSITNITDTGRSMRERFRSVGVTPSTNFSHIVPNWQPTSIKVDNKGELKFTGYAVRYTQPNITGTWKYTMRQEPSLDQYGQRPIPANIYSRYRDTYPQYSRGVSGEVWR